ncbi:hypothetical protein ACFQZ4_29560 [Catellatospora coxensis]
MNRHAPADPAQWTWVLAHCLLHLGFGHLEPGRAADHPAQAAACLVVTRFQQQLRLGKAPFAVPAELPGTDEERLAALWRDTGVPAEYAALGCAGASSDQDLDFTPEPPSGRWARQAAATATPRRPGRSCSRSGWPRPRPRRSRRPGSTGRAPTASCRPTTRGSRPGAGSCRRTRCSGRSPPASRSSLMPSSRVPGRSPSPPSTPRPGRST